MTCCLRHLGLASSFGVDHLRSKNIAAPASIADLTTSEGQQLLQTWLKNPFVVGLFLAPPYGTASRARATPLKRKHGEKLGPGPPPLRNDAHPNGIPGLNFKDKLRIGKANVLYHLTSRLVQQAVNLGMMLCVQNPQYSHFWQTTFWLEVSHLLKYSVFHSCQYGSPRLTRTMLAFNCNEFFTVSLKCPGVSAKHKHAKWGVTAARPLAPAQETAYPMSLARSVAACYVNHLLSCGIKPLPETMDALTSHSAETLCRDTDALPGAWWCATTGQQTAPFASIVFCRVFDSQPSGRASLPGPALKSSSGCGSFFYFPTCFAQRFQTVDHFANPLLHFIRGDDGGGVSRACSCCCQ